MSAVTGSFEIHLTVGAGDDGRLAEHARARGLRSVHIELDRGAHPSQPMLTAYAHGAIADVVAEARRHEAELTAAGMPVVRVKLEADVAADGVPRTDDDPGAHLPSRYFEHHVKVSLPAADPDSVAALAAVVEPHDARVSRNARRRDEDGREQRFVTQRCRGVGSGAAAARCRALVAAVTDAGYEVLEVEQEFVVHDSAEHLDHGWFAVGGPEDERRSRPPNRQHPVTYRPLPVRAGVHQRAVLDAALYGKGHAFRAGEPRFADPDEEHRWYAAREAALAHVLELVATSHLREHLVLRGSALLRAQLGAQARVPGDLDFVVVTDDGSAAGVTLGERVVDDLLALLRRRPGAGLQADDVPVDALWAYDAADGRRLALPWSVPGSLPGTVQVDLVFDHPLERPAVPVVVPPLTVPVLGATPELQLAWKLLWLTEDVWVAAKDLYDAVLLAEHFPVDHALLAELGVDPARGHWGDVEEDTWQDFCREQPTVRGDVQSWVERLATALGVPAPRFG